VARWVLVIVLVLAAVLLATRSMNPISRAAAADTLGRRYAWTVAGWPVWRLLLATVVVLVAFGLATSGGRSATPTPQTAAPRAAPAATTPATAGGVPAATLAATPPPPAVAPVAATSGGIPGWAWLALAAAGILLVVAGLASGRRRGGRGLDRFLAEGEGEYVGYTGYATRGPRNDEYETTDDPWEQAGTWPHGADGPTEEQHVQAPEDPVYEDPEPDDDGDGDDGGPPEAGGGVVADGTVHRLSDRRRRAPRRL
jgi:hypothetical protein